MSQLAEMPGCECTGKSVPFAAMTVQPPTWRRWHEIPRVVGYPPFLKKTAGIALIVGTILFAINHLDEVIRGQATTTMWIKGLATFLVPFCVSNIGLLVGARRES